MSLPELTLIEEKEDFRYDNPFEVTFEGTSEGELEAIDIIKAELDVVLGDEADGDSVSKREHILNRYLCHICRYSLISSL